MPVSFRELSGGEATLTVTYNGHPIQVRYDPSEVSENTVRAVMREMRTQAREIEREAAQDDSIARAMAQFDAQFLEIHVVNALICRFVTWWDLLDDDGRSPFPFDMERLGDLPVLFRKQVITEIMQGMKLGEQNGTPSKKPSRKRS